MLVKYRIESKPDTPASGSAFAQVMAAALDTLEGREFAACELVSQGCTLVSDPEPTIGPFGAHVAGIESPDNEWVVGEKHYYWEPDSIPEQLVSQPTRLVVGCAGSTLCLSFDAAAMRISIEGRRGSIHDVFRDVVETAEHYGTRIEYETKAPWLHPAETMRHGFERIIGDAPAQLGVGGTEAEVKRRLGEWLLSTEERGYCRNE